MAESRAFCKNKLALPVVKIVKAGDVGGQQIRRKLDSAIVGVNGFCQRFCQHGFPRTRYVLKKYVPPGKEGGQQKRYGAFVSDYDSGNITAQRVKY